MGNDGLEDATVVVRAMPMFLRQHNVAGFIADEVFIVGRDEEIAAFPEASRAALVSQIEVTALESLHMDTIAHQRDTFAAVTDIQSRPPYKILQCRWLTALEVFAGKVHQGFVSVHTSPTFYLIGSERVSGLHGQ